MTIIMRPKEESPIFKALVYRAMQLKEEGEDEEGDILMGKAREYGAKVDRCNERGEIILTQLDYEGPDLSPGAVEGRPNAWLRIGRGSVSKRRDESNPDF